MALGGKPQTHSRGCCGLRSTPGQASRGTPEGKEGLGVGVLVLAWQCLHWGPLGMSWPSLGLVFFIRVVSLEALSMQAFQGWGQPLRRLFLPTAGWSPGHLG